VITAEVVEIMELLFEKRKGDRKIIEEVVKAAAGNEGSGKK
jgi:hypothetical protein